MNQVALVGKLTALRDEPPAIGGRSQHLLQRHQLRSAVREGDVCLLRLLMTSAISDR